MIALDTLFAPDTGRPAILPGAYDALSARLVEEAGFDAIYVGSYATAAAAHALPDVGALTLDDLVAVAGAVSRAVGRPVIADAEGGFFDAGNIWRTVQAFERAGVAAIHVEDHAGGKHTDLPQSLIPLDTMLGRLRACLEARVDPAFTIIARTDAIWATGDRAEALRRVRAFAAAGIGWFFPTGATPADLRALRREVPGRYVTIAIDGVDDPAQWAGAADIVIDYGFCLRVASQALRGALGRMKAGAHRDALAPLLEPEAEFERRLGYADYSARARRHG